MANHVLEFAGGKTSDSATLIESILAVAILKDDHVWLSADLLAYYLNLATAEFTIVDVETTGLLDPSQRVIEVCVIQATCAAGIGSVTSTLINPKMRIPAMIRQFTGITQAMLDPAPLPEEVWPSLLADLQTGVLTGHNLAFDYGFLQQEYRRLGIPFARPAQTQLCTVELARLLLPELPSRSLPNLVEHFGFEVGRSHRAEADTHACWLLAERLFEQLAQTSDEILLRRLGQQRIPLNLAARILQTTPGNAKTRLSKHGIAPYQTRNKTFLYYRHDVEKVLGSERDQQLSY